MPEIHCAYESADTITNIQDDDCQFKKYLWGFFSRKIRSILQLLSAIN